MGAYAEIATRRFVTLCSRVAVLRLGTGIGIALFALSLLQYRSYTNRAVFGVWSYPFFALVAATYLLLTFLIFRMLTADLARIRLTKPRGSAVAFDLAVFFWGTAYYVSTLENRVNAGRLTDLDFFGSIAPLPSILEWLSLCFGTLAALLAYFARFGKRHANLLVSISATVCTLLFLEGGLRVYFTVSPMTQGFPSNSAKMWDRKYGFSNSLGWRDVEHEKSPDPSIRRLLVVGDSFAYGTGIKRIRDRFGEQVSSRLVEITGKRWDSINASAGDSHTLDEIKFLRTMLPYQPDVVLLLYVFNDIDYIRRVTPSLKVTKTSPIWILFSNFHLFQQTYILVVKSLGVKRVDDQKIYDDDELVSRHLVDVKGFVALASEHGARAFVVPMDVRVANSQDLRSGHRNFLRLAERAGVPVISALDVYEGVQYRDLIVNWYDHHPNERAHRMAATFVAKQLGRILLETGQ